MGVIEKLQEKHQTSQGSAFLPALEEGGAFLDRQLAWNRLSSLFVKQIHTAWWGQMPLGQTIARLSKYGLSHGYLVDHLSQLFKIEPLPVFEVAEPDIVDVSVAAYSDWLSLAQQLGLMLLSVPVGVEIDGRVKKPFLDSFGPFSEALQRYSSIDVFRGFYSATTFRHLRVISDQSPEDLLREASFQAWALVSLALPKGVTQRVHLTIDPDWVAEVQALRNRFSVHPDVVLAVNALMPTIADQLRLNTLKN